MSELNCPAAESIAALVDGRIQGEERLQVIRHLNQCEGCYELFVEASRFAEAAEQRASSNWWTASGNRGFRAAGVGALATAAILVLAFAMGWFNVFFAPSPREWVQSLETVAQDDPSSLRAQTLARRLSRVVDGIGENQVRVEVVEGIEFPLAMAASRENIRVSEGGLPILSPGGEEPLAEVGSALVLAHELDHVVNQEFGHAFAAYYENAGVPEETSVKRLQDRFPALRSIEDRADRRGLFYTFLAGYDVVQLVAAEGGQGSIFAHFAQAPLGAAADPTHSSPQEREAALRQELARIADRLEVLGAANRFYQAGRFEVAARLLEVFKDEFPSREVFNNLGASYYQLAAEELAGCEGSLAWRYYLPIVVDYRTLEAGTNMRGVDGSPCYGDPDFRTYVEDADDAFRQALQRDPNHRASWTNRMALALLDGPEGDAGVIDEWLAWNNVRETSNSRTASGPAESMLEALLDFQIVLRNVNLTESSLARLRQLQQQHPGYAPLAYNLASALDQARTTFGPQEWNDDAGSYWAAFLELQPLGPYADQARERLRLPAQKAYPSPPQPYPQAPLDLGAVDDATRARLQGWVALTMPAATEQEADPDPVLHRGADMRAFEDASGLVWIEESADEPLDEEDVRSRWGQPQEVVPTSAGSFLRFSDGFGADIVDGHLKALVWFRSE